MRSPLMLLRENYFIRGEDRAFAVGARADLRYALPCAVGGYSKVNAGGPDPNDYLEFAKGDLKVDADHAGANAIGNAKRAVHLAIDGVLRLHGLEQAYGRRNFPEKLLLLADLQAFPTRLIDALNQKRNILEHEFRLVTRADAESLVETAELFLVLAYGFLRRAVLGVYFSRGDSNECIECVVDPLNSVLSESEVDVDQFVETDIGIIHVNVESTAPRKLLRKIELKHGARSEWLPCLNILTYCTRRSAFALVGSGPPGYLALARTELKYSPEGGLPIRRRGV